MAEKTMGEVSRDARTLFQKGTEAVQRENLDYALDLFNQVLEREPGFFEARKALRAAQAKKTGGGAGAGFFKKMLSNAGSSPQVAKAQLTLRKNPADALPIAEQILNGDSVNSAAHRIVVEAAMALEMPRTAVLSLDILLRNSPKDKDLAIRLAQSLAEIGEGQRAEKILMDLAASFPQDAEISQALKDLSAKKTLGEGGYETIAGGQGSYRDILRNEKESVQMEQENRVQKTEDTAERLIREYEARIPNEPANTKLLRSLAELYTQKKQFDRALKLYEQFKSLEGANDSSIDRAIAETTIRKHEHDISQLDAAAPDYAETSANLTAEKLAYQLDEAKTRAENFPTDLAIRFELGVLYFEAGKISEAIQELQKAQGNPHKRIPAMNYLAQCFAKRKMNDLAARTFQNAIKEKPVFDDEKKDLIYNLGCVFESMGKKDEAVEQFKLIYEVDIGYRDVAAKVDAYYAGQ